MRHALELLPAFVVASALVAGCGQSLPWEKRHAAAAASAPPVQTPPPPAGPGRPAPLVRVEDLPEGDSTLTNLDSLVAALGLSPYYALGQHGQGLTIAVLDNGFSGLSHSLGVRLPPGLQVEQAPANPQDDTTHGTKLAEIVWALATGKANYDATIPGPRLLLLNTNGYTNFTAAVDRVIAERADVVLYAQVWEFGGNFDGTGFIDRKVEVATKAGVLWVNAAGNHGEATYGSPVVTQADHKTVTLPYQGRYVRFTVPHDGTPVHAVLSWNDFDDTTTYRTPQDLDLVLEDDQGHEIDAGRKRQTGGLNTDHDPAYSAYARESVDTVLNSGTYFLRVEAHSQNFDQQSRLRITVDGDGVTLLERIGDGTVEIPADDPSVLTVGALDVSYSGRLAATVGRHAKPEASVTSLVTFSNGEQHRGTSSASAIAVGALAVFTGATGRLDHDAAVRAIDAGRLGVRAPCPGAGVCPPGLVLPVPGS